MERIFGISAIALALTGADAGSCKPVTMIQTRASGSTATFENGKWSTKHGLSSVNTASLNGAFYYIIAETIDKDTGYAKDGDDKCKRKNGVSFIHFYSVTFCNPDDALWWFGQRAAGVNGDPAYNLGEYGQYLTFDSGTCEGSDFCGYLTGEDDRPQLGQFVGWQNLEKAERSPTDQSYWYSLPGECPLKTWSDKDDQCKADFPTGACAAGEIPDGEKCTWSYELLGQVNLDELVGITEQTNAAGGKFKDAQEFCEAGKTEFLRDTTTFDFKEGLEFWKNPLDKAANAERVVKLVEHYNAQTDNKKLPTAAALKASNPRCYESTPGCFKDGKETCTRNDEMLCVACDKVDGGCVGDVDEAKAFPTLPEVDGKGDGKETPLAPGKGNTPGGSTPNTGGKASSDEGAATSIAPFSSLVTILAGIIMYRV